MPKPWWESKVIWINAIALGALIYQTASGHAISPEYQGIALAVVNVLLRFVTHQPISLN